MDNSKRFPSIFFFAFIALSILWWISRTAFDVIWILLIWVIKNVAKVQPLNAAPIRYITSVLIERPLRRVAAATSNAFTKFSKAVGFIRKWYPVAAALSWAWNCVGLVYEFLPVVCAFMTGQLQAESKRAKEKKRKSRKIRERREKRHEMKKRGKRITRRAIERLERENMRLRRRNKRIEEERKEKEAKMKAEYEEEVKNLKIDIKNLKNENKRYSATFAVLEQDIQASQRLAKVVSSQLSEAQGAYRTEKKTRLARDMEICALRRRERELAETLKSRADQSAYLFAQHERLRQELLQLRVERAQIVETGTIEVEVKESVDVGNDMESLMTVMEKLLEQHGNDVEGWRCDGSPPSSLVVTYE